MSDKGEALDAERKINRNPHGNFKEVEASRPHWRTDNPFEWTQTADPSWTIGSGSNDSGAWKAHSHISIDPYDSSRAWTDNYKLLISAIIPRPIGFLSTRSADGKSTNLAPFSYTQVVNNDPPILIVGFAGGLDRPKDTLSNLVETGECVINIVSEHFVEAMNACSVNAPYGVSEWAISGLTPKECEVVKASRVGESIFAVEGKLMETKEFGSKSDAKKITGTMAIIEGVRFWAREDAINEEQNLIDPAVLRPVTRLGGITYGRLSEVLEIPRLDWDTVKDEAESKGLDKPKAQGQ